MTLEYFAPVYDYELTEAHLPRQRSARGVVMKQPNTMSSARSAAAANVPVMTKKLPEIRYNSVRKFEVLQTPVESIVSDCASGEGTSG